jgi:GNAT superfamily N-acetyltransferase
VPRRTVDVVPVDQDDLRDVTGLWLAARVDSGSSKEAAHRCVTDGRLTTALCRPGVQAFVARVDGEAVGYAITTENPFGLSPQAELAIEQLWVGPDARRHGVAKALIAAVLSTAERAGCELVVSNVPTTSRDANRFFARLGFSSVIVRRIVSTGQLRRKLAPEGFETGHELLRRRRSLRSRAFATPSRPVV